MINNRQGFTLIELLAAIVIIAVLLAIALPSYQAYVRKSVENSAMQEIQKIVQDLEKYKSRQFNYLNFNAPTQLNLASQYASYNVEVVDGVDELPLTQNVEGRSWIIIAKTNNEQMYSFFINSEGNKCKTKTNANIDYKGCGSEGVAW